jgi:hypothetical protein
MWARKKERKGVATCKHEGLQDKIIRLKREPVRVDIRATKCRTGRRRRREHRSWNRRGGKEYKQN